MTKKEPNEWTMTTSEAMKLSGLSRNFIINAVEQGFIKGTVVVSPSGRRSCTIVMKQNAGLWVKDVESSSNANNGTAPWSGNDSSVYMISASFGGSVVICKGKQSLAESVGKGFAL